MQAISEWQKSVGELGTSILGIVWVRSYFRYCRRPSKGSDGGAISNVFGGVPAYQALPAKFRTTTIPRTTSFAVPTSYVAALAGNFRLQQPVAIRNAVNVFTTCPADRRCGVAAHLSALRRWRLGRVPSLAI